MEELDDEPDVPVPLGYARSTVVALVFLAVLPFLICYDVCRQLVVWATRWQDARSSIIACCATIAFAYSVLFSGGLVVAMSYVHAYEFSSPLFTINFPVRFQFIDLILATIRLVIFLMISMALIFLRLILLAMDFPLVFVCTLGLLWIAG